MKLEDVESIGVLGAGTMGSSIAQICAMAGFSVTLFDIKGEFLEKALERISSNLNKGIDRGKVTKKQKEDCMSRITTTVELASVGADFVIEAVVENLEVKVQLLSILQEKNPAVVLASNTSSLPITSIGSKLNDPSRLVGMHFFNPAHIMKLVEVVKGSETDPRIAELTYHLAEKIGKSPVYTEDSPGFIVNRVARHFYVESLKVLEENLTDHAGIDRLLESSGFRMGPFRLMDLIGVDANFNVTKTMYDQFHQNGKFRPSRIQKKLVDAGHWGRKSGKGFYSYDD